MMIMTSMHETTYSSLLCKRGADDFYVEQKSKGNRAVFHVILAGWPRKHVVDACGKGRCL